VDVKHVSGYIWTKKSSFSSDYKLIEGGEVMGER